MAFIILFLLGMGAVIFLVALLSVLVDKIISKGSEGSNQ